MINRFSKVALLGRFEDERVGAPMQALATHLASRNVTVFTEDALAGEVSSHAAGDVDGAIAAADLAIAIGGDGTMLFAAPMAARHDVPLLGINRGRLGFLADIGPDEMVAGVDDVLDGRFSAEKRLMLTATLPDSDLPPALALNDAVLQKLDPGRMLEFETWVDGGFVNTHGGDGLIVASPTGSTAYALSCGGPILTPHLDAMVLVPVCPHTLSDRPIVIHSSQQVELRLGQSRESSAHITCDGRLLGPLGPGERLIIASAPERVTLIHPPSHDYYDMLRTKLRWGRGRHARPGDV
jgi:NAD+ kinase